MIRSIATMSYGLSFAAALILVPNAIAASNEQTQNQSQQGNQAGEAVQSGVINTTTPPRPTDPAQQISHTITKEEAKGGIPLGNFLLYPALSTTVLYDDNIYASRKNEVSDTVLTITPEMRIKSNFNHHSLEVGSGIDINRYHRFINENTNDEWVYGKGRIDITDSTNLYGGVNFSHSHEDRSSPDAVEISKTGTLTGPIRYTDTGGNIGVYHTFNDRLALRVGGSVSKLNYDNLPLIGGGIYEGNLRDRKESLVGGRLIFTASDTLDLFAQGAADNRIYDNLGIYNRNSHGFNAAVGMTYEPSDSLKGEAYIGRIGQNYDDTRFKYVSAIDYGFNIKYKTTPWTTFSMNLDRSLEETTISGSSGYLNTALSGRIDHRLSPDLSLNASLTRQWSQYNDIDRDDIYTGAGVGAKMYLSNAIYAAADYKYRKRTSSATATDPNYIAITHYADYDNNLVYFTLGTDFGTRAQPETPVVSYPSWSLDRKSVV